MHAKKAGRLTCLWEYVCLQLADHVVHGVEAWLLACEELRRPECASRKDAAVLSAVADLHPFGGAEEMHLVFAGNGAAAKGMHADLLLFRLQSRP